MDISELGEFGLIERLKKRIGLKDAAVKVGIGDDCAVIESSADKFLLLACDVLVEGVHFDRGWMGPFEMGWKGLAIDVSDVAAMGGVPRFALVSLGLTEGLTVEFVDEIYRGLGEVSKLYGVDIVGGDISASPHLFLDVGIVGEVEHANLVLRCGANVGDRILVTGELGGSGMGLELLKSGEKFSTSAIFDILRCAHLLPYPRLKEGRAAVKHGVLSAMIDVSDGLVGDLSHILEASGVGAELWLEKIPISGACREAAVVLGKDCLDFALYGGEDYELLFTCAADEVGAISDAVLAETGTPIAVIGEIVGRAGIVLLEGGKPYGKGLRRGYEHFR